MGVDLARVRKEVAQGFLGKPSKISRSFFDISDISSPETSEVFNFVGRQVKDSLSKISAKGDLSEILRIDPAQVKYLNLDEFFSMAPLLY